MPEAFQPSALRRTIVEMAFAGDACHIGCSFSIVELLACLYGSHLRYNPLDPKDPARDYLVLSKGHGVMAQYACMRKLGWLQQSDLDNYFADGSRLKGLSDAHVPGCEVTSGTLGHGLSVGVGLALAAQRRNTGQRCYAIVGDGEMNEGAIWEALMFSAHARLSNLMVMVDANGWQAMGRTDDVMQLGDIAGRFTAFGFDAVTVDGHDMQAISSAIHHLQSLDNGKPKALVARTVKGKGVPWMEDNNAWHNARLDDAQFQLALAEIGESAA
jgi:transketolase